MSLPKVNGNADENNENILKIYTIDYKPNPKGIGWFCYEKLNEYKNNIAQICTETGAEDTHENLLRRCIRTAIKFQEKGITSSDVVSLCTYNHLNSLVPSIAAQFLCAKVAAFDPTLSQSDTNHLMKQIKPKIIFIVSEAQELIENAIKEAQCETEIVVFDKKTSKYSYFIEDFLKESPKENEFRPNVVESIYDTAYIFFSSGTTGYPKGICCSHYGLLAQNTQPEFIDLKGERFLGFASPYWISTTMMFLVQLGSGNTRLLTPKFIPEIVWNIISKYKCDVIFAAPSQMFDIINVRPTQTDVSSLRLILVGGSAISKDQMIFMREQFPNAKIIQGYGQTEVCGCLTVISPNLDKKILEEKAASCGKPVAGITYKIVDVDTNEIVGPNKVGELRVKTKFQMNGYYNMDSSDCWDEDGYIKTGDMVYYDEDKFFYCVDRIKEMLKYKSWHVQPNVIESVIDTHPAVLKTVVIGIPHPTDGDHPMALVVLKDNYKHVTADEILQFTNDRVHERQKLRGGLKIVKDIPLTPSGKIQRRMVRNLVLNNQL